MLELVLTVVTGLLAGLLLLASGFSLVCLAWSGSPAGQPTLEQLAQRCQGLRGWALVERAQQEVHAAMPDYGFCNGFDTPRMALARGRGYCWQRAGVLLRVLRQLGVEARMVHAFWTRFESHGGGHVWLQVSIDGEQRWVCPGDARNSPGEVQFTPRSRVRAWRLPILVLSTLGSPIVNMFAFVVDRLRGGSSPAPASTVNWRTRLSHNGQWPMLAILAWNAALASRLPAAFADDSGVPSTVLTIEALGRVFVFATPALLILDLDDRVARAGLASFIVGGLAYFGSWAIPLSDPTPSWLWLGPFLLPAVWLVGLGLMARCNAYIVGAMVFVLAHLTHGYFMLRHVITP